MTCVAEKKKTETLAEPEGPITFTKQQLLASNRYRHQRDLLEALLQDGGTYSLAEVDARINKFLKEKVK